MVTYNFKTLHSVPTAKDLVDIVLSRTQRKTPTAVHPGYKISRIQKFYLRKVKYAQTVFNERFSRVLDEFPRLDDIHPFYADLMNVLYDKDHYKLALGQVNTVRGMVDQLGKEYVGLIKTGDDLYRCKQLKRACLGRMCTLVRKLKASLDYLEEVRQHLSRLPSIDPNTRTLILCGFPNVGKSSFINKVSRADVEVQNYPFTTKSLFVGHFDYRFLRWQVIDTPGILDHPLEDRNTIEMQAITALAHLRAAVMFFIDISESCGYSIEQQVNLFESIKPLFVNKPLLLVVSKVDLVRLDELSAAQQAHLGRLGPVSMVSVSSVSEEGIMEARDHACDRLLDQRVATKSTRLNSVASRITIVQPQARDTLARPAFVPEHVSRRREREHSRAADEHPRTLRDEEAENGGPGVFQADLRRHWELAKPEWRYDPVPEIVDGMNVADYVDPDILARLEELEREEEARLDAEAEADAANTESDVDSDTMAIVDELREERAKIRQAHARANANNKVAMSRRERAAANLLTADDMREGLRVAGAPGHKADEAVERAATRRSRSQSVRNARRRDADDSEGSDADVEMGARRGRSVERGSKRVVARSRSKSLAHDGTRVLSTHEREAKVTEQRKVHKELRANFMGRAHESDRRVATAKPKHLFSGKRDFKADRR